MRLPALATLACTLIALSLGACRKDEIVTYRVIKDPAPTPPAGPAAPSTMPAAAVGPMSPLAAQNAMANTAVTTASGPGLAWTAPAGWTVGPERAMRKATLLIPGEGGAAGGEIAITAFPGDVGGNLANINRWRGQLSLPPIGEAELGAAVQHIDIGALHVDVVELVGPGTPPAQRVLGAIVPHGGATWFFKLTGPDALVAREKENFLAFLKTVRPQG